jgi:hypothetical protein
MPISQKYITVGVAEMLAAQRVPKEWFLEVVKN